MAAVGGRGESEVGDVRGAEGKGGKERRGCDNNKGRHRAIPGGENGRGVYHPPLPLITTGSV